MSRTHAKAAPTNTHPVLYGVLHSVSVGRTRETRGSMVRNGPIPAQSEGVDVHGIHDKPDELLGVLISLIQETHPREDKEYDREHTHTYMTRSLRLSILSVDPPCFQPGRPSPIDFWVASTAPLRRTASRGLPPPRDRTAMYRWGFVCAAGTEELPPDAVHLSTTAPHRSKLSRTTFGFRASRRALSKARTERRM
ncbi:hypothetical protein CDEST_13632 [Colletotrichum destructivum]|uniref:Uncharacterized protein n=1 Tax=Colletotrichum destructivum TaxID=34406 RepID=A0AAX4IZA5_9PEZI|nr:hypothetical protein CDEST_13632 [Colletotrichum destructivum]